MTPQSHLTRIDEDGAFPFEAWARTTAYPYRERELPLYKACRSAAEVFFLRPFAERPDLTLALGGAAHAGGLTLQIQAPIRGYVADFLVSDGITALAIEIDGMAFHHRTKEQVAADYLRQRRIVARGYTVIRYTAQEAFRDAPECWRQVDAIFAARRRSA